MAQSFNDGENIDEFDEFLTVSQNLLFKFFFQ